MTDRHLNNESGYFFPCFRYGAGGYAGYGGYPQQGYGRQQPQQQQQQQQHPQQQQHQQHQQQQQQQQQPAAGESAKLVNVLSAPLLDVNIAQRRCCTAPREVEVVLWRKLFSWVHIFAMPDSNLTHVLSPSNSKLFAVGQVLQ